jgi:hypothetical protein
MDFINSLPETKGNHDAVMVIVDKLTKLVMFIPTRTDMDTVATVSRQQCLQATTLRQIDKHRKQIELWWRLSDTTSTTNKIIGTIHCRDSNMHTIVVCIRIPD